MPLYRCADCGFVTTASLENAFEAHVMGSPHCLGELAMIADFNRTPVIAPGSKRRRAARPPPVDPDGGVSAPPPREG